MRQDQARPGIFWHPLARVGDTTVTNRYGILSRMCGRYVSERNFAFLPCPCTRGPMTLPNRNQSVSLLKVVFSRLFGGRACASVRLHVGRILTTAGGFIPILGTRCHLHKILMF